MIETVVFGRKVEVERDWRRRPRGAQNIPRKRAITKSGKRISDEAWEVMAFLRRARIGAGMTQSDVAGLVGISQTRLADYEAGRFEPSVGKVLRIAKAIGVTELPVIDAESEGRP